MLQFYSFLIYLNQEFPFNLKVFFRMLNFDYLWKEVEGFVGLGGGVAVEDFVDVDLSG
jgi:hypothetical protein